MQVVVRLLAFVLLRVLFVDLLVTTPQCLPCQTLYSVLSCEKASIHTYSDTININALLRIPDHRRYRG